MGQMRSLVFKIVELMLIFMSFIFHILSWSDYPFNWYVYLIFGAAYVGYTILLTGLVIAALIKNPIDEMVNVFYCLLGVIVFVIVGAVVIRRAQFTKVLSHSKRSLALAEGSMDIINAAFLLVDVIFLLTDAF